MEKYEIDAIKKNQIKKYEAFNIENSILEDYFSKASTKYTDQIEMINYYSRQVENYIVNEIKNDNIDMQISVIDYYSNLKTRIKVNQKYNVDDKLINDAYDKAIELLKENYDNNKQLYINILSNMKYVLTGVKEEVKEEVKLYDMSFMKDYINCYGFNRNNLIKSLDIDKNRFNNIVDGKELINNEKLNIILDFYSLNKYEDLKKFVKNELDRYYKKKLKKESKNINNIYDISFMKEYLKIKNIPKIRLAQILEVTNSSIDKILDGSYLINEDKIKLLYTLFKVNNYEELKSKINQITSNKDKKIIKEDKYDFSFMKEYVLLYEIPKKELANIFKCGINKIDDILDGKLLLKKNITEEVCYELNSNNYEELKETIQYKINKKKEIMKEKEAKEKRKLDNIKIINLNKFSTEEILNLLDYKGLYYKDLLITLLLFSNELNYSIKEISDILKIEEEDVIKVYKYDLNKIKEKLEKKYNSVNLVYKIKE